MAYESCWLINFKSGTKLIFSETAYREKHKPGSNIKYIESEEHWFLMSQCIDKNPRIDVIE